MINKIEEIINEDLTHISSEGNRYDWMQKSQPLSISILDILKMNRDELDRARSLMPYQAEPVLSKLYSSLEACDDLKNDFRKIVSHPIVKQDSERREVIKRSQARLNGIIKAYIKIIEDIDNLKLDH